MEVKYLKFPSHKSIMLTPSETFPFSHLNKIIKISKEIFSFSKYKRKTQIIISEEDYKIANVKRKKKKFRRAFVIMLIQTHLISCVNFHATTIRR